MAHIEVAKSDAREVTGLLPFPSAPDVVEDAETPERVLRAKEGVENDELQHNVTDVQQFCEQVECGQIDAVALAELTEEECCCKGDPHSKEQVSRKRVIVLHVLSSFCISNASIRCVAALRTWVLRVPLSNFFFTRAALFSTLLTFMPVNGTSDQLRVLTDGRSDVCTDGL